MPLISTQLPESLDRIVKRFQRLADPKQRYEQLILYGQKLQNFPPEHKVAENKVPGCVSQVYVMADLNPEGGVIFNGDSDALISKGFVGLLAAGMNGLTPTEIQALSADFIQDTGLSVSLTPSRANGFMNVFHKMQQKAAALISSDAS
jgi:cysteine desulfuration protein SufE